jgi:hypothetical protein
MGEGMLHFLSDSYDELKSKLDMDNKEKLD